MDSKDQNAELKFCHRWRPDKASGVRRPRLADPPQPLRVARARPGGLGFNIKIVFSCLKLES